MNNKLNTNDTLNMIQYTVPTTALHNHTVLSPNMLPASYTTLFQGHPSMHETLGQWPFSLIIKSNSHAHVHTFLDI